MARPPNPNNTIHKVCPTCNNPFTHKKCKPKKYCSKTCAANSPEVKEKNRKGIEKTFQRKYGGHAMKTEAVKKNFKDAIKKKYGVDAYSQLPEWKVKVNKTCMDKHGVPFFINTQKIKETKLKRYGNENYRNDEKRSQTIRKLYGVDHFSKCKEFTKKHFDRMYDLFLNSEKFNKNFVPDFTREQYKGVIQDGRYKFKCKRCNLLSVSDISDGSPPSCPKCDKRSSYFQTEIFTHVKDLCKTETVLYNDRMVLGGKELDIYIPQLKVAIECDGLYWHSELSGKHRSYHLGKTTDCSKLGIKLIHIFEDEWINKKEIIKNKLRYILKKQGMDESIYARECEAKEIKSKQTMDFLEKYHIQGSDNSSIKLGLFYKEELVSVMTFGKKRVALGNSNPTTNDYEMFRFCVSNKPVIGAAGKLLKYFIKKYDPKSILTFADLRYSNLNVNLYEKLGFKFIERTKPNYWYINTRNLTRYHRYNFAKHTLFKKLKVFKPELSEWDNMKENGYDRIWDCGNLKYIMYLD